MARRVFTSSSLAALVLVAHGARADIPPDHPSCVGRPAGTACQQYNGQPGACRSSTCATRGGGSTNCMLCLPGAPTPPPTTRSGACSASPGGERGGALAWGALAVAAALAVGRRRAP